MSLFKSFLIFTILKPLFVYGITSNSFKKSISSLQCIFTNSKLFLILKTVNIPLFISSGMFLPWFQLKKMFIKSDFIKLQMAVFLRKIFLLVKISDIFVELIGHLKYFRKFFTTLFTTIVPNFFSPFLNELIYESKLLKKTIFLISFMVIKKSYPLFSKRRKKGFIKRKINKKITRRSTVDF